MIDPDRFAYYTVADGHGPTTAAREPGIHVGGDARPAAQRCPSVLCATESDPRSTRLRRMRRKPVPTILRGRRSAGTATRMLCSAAADRLFRRLGCRARDCVAGGGFACAARVSR